MRQSWSTNYYALKREVAQEINDYVLRCNEQLANQQPVEPVADFVARLSFASGLAESKVYDLMEQRGIRHVRPIKVSA